MKENNLVVCYSNKKNKDKNSLHNSASCPSIFNKNNNNSIFVINSNLEKIKNWKKISFSQLTENNKSIILRFFNKDKLQFSGTSGHSIFDILKEENIEDNEFFVEYNNFYDKKSFENRSSDQVSQSNPKSSNIIYIIQNNDAINNQLSCNKNEEYKKEIKELKKIIETQTKEMQDILNINNKLKEEVEKLNKEKDKLYSVIETMNKFDKYEELKREIQLLKEAKLLEKNKKELNEDLQNNENLINKNENKEENNYEIKMINEMRKEYKLGDEYKNEKLSKVLKENDYDIDKAFSKLFPD